MSERNERGREILQELGIEGFMAVSADDILQFEHLSTLGEELMIKG
jgi:hypothetical protein